MKKTDSKLKVRPRIIRRGLPGIARSPTLNIQRKQIGEILRNHRIQAKLTIGQPNDKYEREADRVADQIMGMPEPPMQHQEETEQEEAELRRQPGTTEDETEEKENEQEELQTKANHGRMPRVSAKLEDRIRSLKGGGQPLPSSELAFFEPRMGQDLGHVRLHTNSRAVEAAHAINARAFTSGKDIVFGTDQYRPGTTEGRRLLAHELTHVGQQTKAVSKKDIWRQAAPASAWTQDLLTVVFMVEGVDDCIGTATPGETDPYSRCGSPVVPPFCLSARLPAAIRFYIDRATRRHPDPHGARKVSVELEFVNDSGRRSQRRRYVDSAPRYRGPNYPLRPSFGHSFSIGATRSGTWYIRAELKDSTGVTVRYTDRIRFIVRPCT